MGLLLSKLQVFKRLPNEVILDFLDVDSSHECQAIKTALSILNDGQHFLERFRDFKSHSAAAVKLSMQKPCPEHEQAALVAVLPSLLFAREIYDFGTRLTSIIPALLQLVSSAQANDNIAYQQVLCRTIAKAFDFVLYFDFSKKSTPELLTDVNVFRRLSKKGVALQDNTTVECDPIRDSEIVLILAQATPFTSLMATKLKETILNNGNDNLIEPLCEMTNVCAHALSLHRFTDTFLVNLLMRSLTGSLLLIDHVCPEGAFQRSSKVNSRKAILALKQYLPDSGPLLSALKYSSCTFSRPTTPNNVQSLLQSF
ncbi:hypothetical protein RCL1_002898 [Eukaryota sp. TZLM3-RCL]